MKMKAVPLKLRMGVDSPAPSWGEMKRRAAVLGETCRRYIPTMVESVQMIVKNNQGLGPDDSGRTILALPQDAFAAQYDIDEYTLLGMFIKYAGLFGVSVWISGQTPADAEQEIQRRKWIRVRRDELT